MIRRKTFLGLLGKSLVAFAGAAIVLFLWMTPAQAAPGTDKIDPDASDVCVRNTETGEYTCNGESLIAKECDGTKEVSDEWTNMWYALSPSGIGCAAINSLDWTMSKMGVAMDATTVVLTTSEGNNRGQWFATEYGFVRTISIWTIPPIFLIAIMHALFSGKYDMMLKVALAYLPTAVIGSVVAIEITQLLLNITDDISKAFQSSIEADTYGFMVGIAKGFGAGGYVVTGEGGKAWAMSLILGIGLLLATAVMYIILSLREASIYIAALFMPIVFAMLIWPPLQKWFKKLVEFLIGMILSKVIMVAAISLMVASFAALFGTGSQAAMGIGLNGTTVTAENYNQSFMAWFAQCVTMLFTFFVVCFAPNIPSKLFANVSFDDTGRAQATLMNRPDMKRRIDFGNRMVGIATQLNDVKNAYGQRGPARDYGLTVDVAAREKSLTGVQGGYTVSDREAKGFKKPPPGPLRTAHEYQVSAMANAIDKYGSSGQVTEMGFADILMEIGADRAESMGLNIGDGDPNDPLPPLEAGGFSAANWTRTDHEGNKTRRVELVAHGHDQDNNVVEVQPAVLRAAINDLLIQAEKEGNPIGEIQVHIFRAQQNPGSAFGPSDKVSTQADRERAAAQKVLDEFKDSGVRMKLASPDKYGTSTDDDYERLKMFRT